MKSVRFAQVVEHSGRPTPHVLWTDPKQDRELQRAVREGRVMTIHQEVKGNRKDFGLVGFHRDRGELLVFPHSVRRFEGRRVIGLNYDLVAKPKRARAAEVARLSREDAKRRGRSAKETETVVAKAPEARAAPASRSRTQKPRSDRASRSRKTAARQPKKADPAQELARMRREVERAAKALEQGRAVAAHRRLKEVLRKS